MSFSSGVFSLAAGNPVVTGTTISSTWANDTLDDLADNGLSLCMLKDGTQTVTANIPFGGFRLTNVGNATALTDGARCSQVQNGAYNVLSSVAGTNTITAATVPAITAYAEGQVFRFLPAVTNTGQATLNISSVGAAPIFMDGATATSSALRSGMPLEVMYISTSSATGFHVIAHSGFAPLDAPKFRGNVTIGDNAAAVLTITTDKVVTDATHGSLNFPFQPTFSAINSATDADVTGDNTLATVDFDTEIFDVGGNFTTDTFTAPVTGKYRLSAAVTLAQLGTSHTGQQIYLVTSNRTYSVEEVITSPPWTTRVLQISVVAADMDAGDTVTVAVRVSGGSKVVDVVGAAGPSTFFSGGLAS